MPLPVEHRFRADVVALCCGFAAGPLAPLVVKYVPPDQLGIAILMLMISAALAGAILTVLYLNRANLSSADASHVIRSGARAGLLSATLAAAMSVLAARTFQSQVAAVVVLLPAVLSILPASFFGLLATAYAVGLRFPILAASAPTLAEPTPRRIPLIFAVVAVVVFGFGSVLIPQKVKEVATNVSPIASTPTASSWQYEKPAELGSADASRWELMTTKPIGRVREGAPLAISRAGDRVAYVDGEQSNAVKVVELDRPDRISTFSINGSLNRMSFSPEGNQILFDTYQEGKRMGVIDLSKGRVITIPRPKGQAIPPG
ncbi:MAG TPA: hypothetical protein VF511_06150, partial [Chthoniobacterales bacterium]